LPNILYAISISPTCTFFISATGIGIVCPSRRLLFVADQIKIITRKNASKDVLFINLLSIALRNKSVTTIHQARDAAETVPGIYGFDRTMYDKPKDKKWWIKLRRNRMIDCRA